MRYRLIAGCLCLALSSAFAPADVKLPALFSPHAVIQRDAPVPVWGWADPGERVTAELKDGERTIGMSVSTVAGRQGRWRVTLGPFAAGGPWRLAVSGRNTVNVDDVLVGEVWICSGQSNMQWSVSHANDAEQEVRAADHPGIRLFSVPHQVSPAAVRDVSARWEACTPQTVGRFSAVGYFFGREMHRHLGVPVGLIHSSWGGTPAEAWTRRRELARHAVLAPILERYDRALAGFDPAMKSFRQRLAEWKERAAAARSAGRRPPPRPLGPDHPHAPGGLWRGMIAPLVPFAVRGVIWYQGEANATRAFQYRTLFPAMIRDWRQAWGQGDFPFLFVQLANFRARKPEPADSDWAELREAQAMALELPATGMAVAIDIGEANDIHPRNKQEVGRRLALQARAVAHGETLVHSGPMLERAEPDGGAITVRFTHVGSGLVVRGERLEGFEVAGADGKFHRADAGLLLPERADAAAAEPAVRAVRVTSPAVPQPLHVRYAWADNPAANLYNREGLPAAPFRTDDLPGVTAGAR